MPNKTILSSIFFVTLSLGLLSQNVGIGVVSPSQTLDVNGSFRIRHTANNTAGFWIDGITLPTRSFIGQHNDDHFGFYGNNGAGWSFLINNVNNNVGLGIEVPQARLDINGNLRIRNSSNTAGIWFDGNLGPTRSLIGTVSENYFGIWGNGGTGWNFNVDVTTGNIGIGTQSPTKKLDLNGTLRIRSNTPVKGSVLTCTDALGNAEWVNPSAFKGHKTLNDLQTPVPPGTWQKVLFNVIYNYNVGQNYDANNSNFIAPVDGIYQFNSMVDFVTNQSTSQSIRFVLNRNGALSTIAEIYDQGFYGGIVQFGKINQLNTDVQLLAGDLVWVEVFHYDIEGEQNYINYDESRTWFSGNLVAKL